MISHQHKCIFVHLRRTAGNSIELALGGIVLLDKNRRQVLEWDNNLHRSSLDYKINARGHAIHSTAKEIREQHSEFKSYFKFSIVRNPWDQMLSLYLRSHWSRYRSFSTIIRPSKRGFRRWLEKFHTYAGTVPQHSIFDGEECLVNRICRYESLQTDFDKCCDEMGISRRILSQTNLTQTVVRDSFYDVELIEIVADIFRKDIDRFCYRFIQY